MTDNRFDPELSERLRAYESRLPAAPPPLPGASPSRRIPRWPLVGLGTLAAVAAVLLVTVLLRQPTDEKVGTGSPSPMPSASIPASTAAPSLSAAPTESVGPTPTPRPTASASDPTVDLRWTETASFGSADAPSVVNDVVRSDGGLIAVGVQYEHPLPNLGPTPPHEGRVWLATDLGQWEDVTPDGTFENRDLRHLLLTSDGRIIAHGQVGTEPSGGVLPAAWESIAGRQWRQVEIGFPDDVWPVSMAQNARGHVAIVADSDVSMQSVWWSADGRTWERVHDLHDPGGYRVGAGDEGFVVAGWRSTGQGYVVASADGRVWLEASTPPGLVATVAPRGGDWVVLTREPETVSGEPSTAGVWTSLNGLDWASAGAFPLYVRYGECTEWPTSLYAAGAWLISGTILAHPCTEGGYVTHGAQRISLDGVEWSELPFGAASSEGNLGTRIGGALEVDGRLVLIGERDRVATFWIGEQP